MICSKANLVFSGKEQRQSITLSHVPILIALSRDGVADEEDITLGISGIFDNFEITFKKINNKIIFKKVSSINVN